MEFSIRRPAPLAGASRFITLCVLAAAALAGCGGGGGSTTDATTTSGAVAPQITTQPQNASVSTGQTATFTVTATGGGSGNPVTYTTAGSCTITGTAPSSATYMMNSSTAAVPRTSGALAASPFALPANGVTTDLSADIVM